MTKKFAVYAIYTASKYIGEFEADDKEAAIDRAVEDGDEYVSLCWECSKEIELNDMARFEAEEILPPTS